MEIPLQSWKKRFKANLHFQRAVPIFRSPSPTPRESLSAAHRHREAASEVQRRELRRHPAAAKPAEVWGIRCLRILAGIMSTHQTAAHSGKWPRVFLTSDQNARRGVSTAENDVAFSLIRRPAGFRRWRRRSTASTTSEAEMDNQNGISKGRNNSK